MRPTAVLSLWAMVLLVACSSSSTAAVENAEPELTLACDTELPLIIDVLRSDLPMYDYDPYPSLDAMADAVSLVVVGELESIGSTPGTNQIMLTLRSSEVLRANDTATQLTSFVSEGRWPKTVNNRDLPEMIALANVEVLVFLHAFGGDYVPDIQGFFISCTDSVERARHVIEPPPPQTPESINDIGEAIRPTG